MLRYGLVGALLLGSASFGAQGTFIVQMTGPQEVPGPGDPDGTGSGTISLNDVSGVISWNFTYANIDPPTLMHIHTGASGVQGGILINLGVTTTGGLGTLINSTTHGNLAQVTSVLNNPLGFYVNIHNGPFGGGAIRGQIGSQRTYVVNMTGAQEVPGPGDPDGTASGTISLNDVTGLVSWNFIYANIDPPTLMHIHTGAAGVQGGILINLGVATTGGPGTLINSTTHGNLAQVTSVLNNPMGFYVNIHNGPFGGGAVRGQISCDMDADCDDGLFCTGTETCNTTTDECEPGTPPCGPEGCIEDQDKCPTLSVGGVAVLVTLLTGMGAAVIRRRKP